MGVWPCYDPMALITEYRIVKKFLYPVELYVNCTKNPNYDGTSFEDERWNPTSFRINRKMLLDNNGFDDIFMADD